MKDDRDDTYFRELARAEMEYDSAIEHGMIKKEPPCRKDWDPPCDCPACEEQRKFRKRY